MQERREYTRVVFNRHVVIAFSDGETMASVARDFSINGIAVMTDVPLSLGETLYVEFSILSQDDWRDVNLRGKVVYSEPTQEHYKNGINFY